MMSNRRSLDPMRRIGPLLQVTYTLALVTSRRLAPVLGLHVTKAYFYLRMAEDAGLVFKLRDARPGRPPKSSARTRADEPGRQTIYALTDRGVERLVAWEAEKAAERSAA